jgi:sulfur-oxidizing protein SoxY
MQRREFLSLGAGVLVAASVMPATLRAENFRVTKPKLWHAKTVDTAIKDLYGTTTTTKGHVTLKAPDIAENGAMIPISFKTDLKASTMAVFQDVNPESCVAVFTVPKNGIPSYDVRIKMAKTGTITVVAEVDGKLYSTSKTVKVTIGGCGG